MSAILIKSTGKKQDNLIMEIAKLIKAPVKLLDDSDELDILLVESIEKGMKTGKGSRDKVRKFFGKYGIRIH